jgi:arginase
VITYLLYPEWQGYGVEPSVYDGANAMARVLFPGVSFARVEAPREETLAVDQGVLGLSSIASRFRDTLTSLRSSAPDVIVTVGGTCGVEAAPVAYLNERYGGDLAVVWFDAHGDLNSPATSPSGHFHGMVLRTLLGTGPREYVDQIRRPLQPSQVFLAGTRDLDPDESAFIRDAGISVTSSQALADAATVARAIRNRGLHNVYLHLDLDCFRPDEIPDTLMRTPGGPTFDAVVATLAALRTDFHVAGSSIVEYADRGGDSFEKLRRLVPVATP